MPARLDSARRRALPRPTVRGGVLAALGLVGVVIAFTLHRADLLLVGLILVLAVAASHLLLLLDRGQRLTAHRSIRPDAVNAGEVAAVTVVLRGADGQAVRLHRWHDAAPPGVVAERSSDALEVPGDPGVANVHTTIRAPRRGLYRIGPLTVDRVDPLGLATLRFPVGGAAPLLVRPRVVPLQDSLLDEAAAGGADLVVMRRRTPSVDEVSAREYERGDPMRRVNWRASAKRGRLMVRQEEQRSNPQSWLLLDTAVGRGSDAFEQAIELAASIGAHAMQRGFTIGVVETGGPQLDGDEVPYGAGYAPPEGERLFVAQLAALTAMPSTTETRESAVGAFADGLRRSGSGTAAFAIVLDGSAGRWSELAGLRALAEPAVAFVVGSESGPARRELESAGWTCVAVEPGMGSAEAWEAATEAAARLVRASRV